MTGIDDHLSRTGREVRDGGADRAVVLRRGYDAPVQDVWDACTDAERLGRWFLPVSGDLRLGGRYQLEGNAGGEIRRCEPPRLLLVSWEFGGNESEVEVRLSPDGDGGTAFELEHRGIGDPEFWDRFGPGAVGVGWDMTALGLGLYLAGTPVEDPVAWQSSPAARDFVSRTAAGWGEAHRTAGAPADQATAAAAETAAFYTPPTPTEP
ncbi:MAG: SRPBCC family protein [Mycobacteriales bacterium]